MSLIIPANSASASGYAVDNSCRFNDGSSDTLSITPSSASNRRTWTWSCWVKRCTIGTYQVIFVGASPNTWIRFRDDDKLELFAQEDYKLDVTTTMLFRDVSAWYHICVSVDLTQGTESNRVKIYVNGSLVDVTITYAVQNFYTGINNTGTHYIGRLNYVAVQYIDMYLSEMVLIDGTQNAVTDFGEFDEDSGIWKPIDVSGLTFGTNGFYLDFEDSAALGDDVSGNGNDFTVNNLTAIDQTTDTPTNNFATLNPLAVPSGANTFSEGNLIITNSADENRTSFSSIGVQSGKWYFEAKFLSGEMKQYIGISKQETVDRIGASANSYGYAGENARKWNNNSYGSYGSTASTGDIIMVAFDADNGTIWVGKNGTWFDSATQAEIEAGTTTNAMYSSITINDIFMMGFSMEDSNIEVNFGNAPYTISSGNADGNGYGNFEYAVPSGYLALCTANLSEVLS